MSKIAQISILILFLLLGGSVFMVLSTLNQKQALEKLKNSLQNDLDDAQIRETKLLKDSKDLDNKLKESEEARNKIQKDLDIAMAQSAALKDQVGKLAKDKDQWKTRVDDIRKERDELMAKMQVMAESQAAAQAALQAAAPVPPQPQTPQATLAATPVPASGQAAMQTAQAYTEPPAPAPAQAAAPSREMVSSGDERYWADILKEKADLTLQVENFKDQLNKRALEVDDLKNKNSELELKISELTNAKEDIESQIKYGQSLASNLSLELARAKNEKKYEGERIDKLQEENRNLRGQIKQLGSSKLSLEKSIARLNEDKSTVERKLLETENMIQGRIDDIWQVKESLDKTFNAVKTTSDSKEVELPPIIVSAAGPAVSEVGRGETSEPTPGVNGKVISVNDENNFVILDLGENSGIQLGDSLAIYRGSEYIAGLEVIQVRKDISAADIKEKGARIKVGDTVR